MGTQELPRTDMNSMNGTLRVAYFCSRRFTAFPVNVFFFEYHPVLCNYMPSLTIRFLLKNHDRVFVEIGGVWGSIPRTSESPALDQEKNKSEKNIPSVSVVCVSSRIQDFFALV